MRKQKTSTRTVHLDFLLSVLILAFVNLTFLNLSVFILRRVDLARRIVPKIKNRDIKIKKSRLKGDETSPKVWLSNFDSRCKEKTAIGAAMAE